jgi:hypothetical protein
MRAGAASLCAALAALALAGPAGGAPAPVKDGRYAGGSKEFNVFFNVTDRTIPRMRIYSDELASCAIGGPAVFDSDIVDSNGRFELEDHTTFPNDSFTIDGRFVSATHVKGKVKWTTTQNCPAGVYKFDFTADRFAPVS